MNQETLEVRNMDDETELYKARGAQSVTAVASEGGLCGDCEAEAGRDARWEAGR